MTMAKTLAVLNSSVRPILAPQLPSTIEPRWFDADGEALALADEAEIGWFDTLERAALREMVRRSPHLRWIVTAAAGVDSFPLDLIAERGIVLTNGAGLHAATIAEYAVMAMLTIAKGYREVVRAQDRHEWLHEPPGKRELRGTRALIIGAGAIGGRVADLLRGFGVEVVAVRRHAANGAIGADEWRGRLAEFDWVLVTTAATSATDKLIGAAEFAAMRRGVTVLNFARGFVLDQDALIAALRSGQVGAAFLDVTDPEPLPPDHPLWDQPNAHISMHLSGRSQDTVACDAVSRFLDNLERWRRGAPLSHVVDLRQGY